MAKGITLSNSRQEFGHLVLGGVFSSDLGHCVYVKLTWLKQQP
ncbi:hypothetical protein LJIJOHLM_00145 [Escherichia phage KKP 3954]|nr:hypothetical protein LJIJOHLM_00145 [Escherichia phage KKP 3954]